MAINFGRFMIDCRQPCPQARRPSSRRRSMTDRGTTRSRLTPVPMMASTAGRSVIAAAIDTSGISTPPMPIERMNGSGSNTSSASPIATVTPENSTARPAVFMVGRAPPRRSSGCALELFAVAVDDQQRVVDRDRDADQRHQLLDVDGHVHEVGDHPHESERGRHGGQGHDQGHGRRRRRCRR